MQFSRVAVIAVCSALAWSRADAAATVLIPMDEPVTSLASPASASPAIPTFQYNFGAKPVATMVTANPLLCGNTVAPTAGTSAIGVNPVYYSANGLANPVTNGNSVLFNPFVFGASSNQPTVSAIAYGATNLNYDGSQVQFGGDPLDALVCYGLDANGVHKVTRDLFADGFEVPGTDGLLGNSTVTLSVLRVPGVGNSGNEYDYYIDAFLPDLSGCGSLDCNFVLMEGYDTSLFDTSGRWCKDNGSNSASPGNCSGTWVAGDINLQTANGTTKLVAGHNYFAVKRYTLSSNALPSAPVAITALFSPLDLHENKLDDNVATGNNTLANVAPSVTTDSAFTAGAASLQENTDSGTFTFSISDSDSPESGSNLLHATVMLKLPDGIVVPVTPDCTTLIPNNPPMPLPVNRTCTFALPFHTQPGFWDGSVATQYQGQFNNVATDTTNGTYASGVSASIQIVATDAQGKNSAAVSTPVHIFSTFNNPPTATIDASQLPSAPDPNDNNTDYPTYSCSINAGDCGGNNPFPHTQHLPAVAVAVPGPVAAFDELASQTTVANDLQCAADGAATQVAFVNAPAITSGSTANQFDIAFQFANPPVQGSSLCTITIADDMATFPNGEAAKNVNPALVFRIVVNP